MEKVTVRTVIVLGMHRSGTSMTAGVLSKLGVDMGGRRLERNRLPGNPLGHFEDRAFVTLNTDILTRAGGNWQDPPSREAIITEGRRSQYQLKNLLAALNGELIGWKDPRTSLTIELYLPYLINPFFIVCHRQPQAVAASLYRRNQLSFKKGVQLQNIYEERLKVFFTEHPELPKLDLWYEEVTGEPEKWIREITCFLGIKPGPQQLKDAVEFILPNEVTHQLASQLERKLRQKISPLSS